MALLHFKANGWARTPLYHSTKEQCHY